jgi:DNA-binding NtrC family response regulator
MESPLILLFTRDGDFAQSVGEALFATGAVVLMARDLRDAWQLVCQHGRKLDSALMDFDDGCRGMTLLSAVHTCYERLPILVTTSQDSEHASFLACANGARACLKKPLSAADFAKVISHVTAARHQPVAAERERSASAHHHDGASDSVIM